MSNFVFYLVCEMFLDVHDRLLHGKSVTYNDGGGMDLLPDKFIRVLEKFSSNDDNTGGTITNLFIMESRNFNKNFGCIVFNAIHSLLFNQ